VKAQSARPRDFNQRVIVKSYLWRASSWRTPEGDGGMRTIPFKPRDPETRTDVNVISWPMKRLTIHVPIEKIADVVRVLIEREFPPQS
jgi:hypothetical protein